MQEVIETIRADLTAHIESAGHGPTLQEIEQIRKDFSALRNRLLGATFAGSMLGTIIVQIGEHFGSQ